jgi:hypothetical protein
MLPRKDSSDVKRTTLVRRTTAPRRRARRASRRTSGRRARKDGSSDALSFWGLRGPETMFSRIAATPDRMFVKLRYLEPPYQTGALSGGTIYVDKYAQNATYDPYLGAGGGQPSGLAQCFAKYQFCRVWASTCTLRITRNEHNSDSPYEIGLIPVPFGGTPSPPTTFATYIEQPYAMYREGVSVYADQPHVLKRRIETNKLAGLAPVALMHNGYYHNNAANSVNLNEWHIVLLQSNAIVGNTALQVSVEIEYECEFFQRTATPASYLDEVYSDAIRTGRAEEIKRKLAGEVKVMPHLRETADESKVEIEVIDLPRVARASTPSTNRSTSSTPVVKVKA